MEERKLYLNIINNLSDGVYFVDKQRRITFWNKAAEEISGYTADEVVGSLCNDNLLSHIDDSGRPLCIVGCPLFDTICDGVQRKDKVYLRHKDGHRIPILVNIFSIKDGEEIVGAVEIFTRASPTLYDDVLIEKLSNSAMKDGLTKLPNRRYLESYLDYKLNDYGMFHSPFAVLFADIDNFSKFNNKYGHDVGDAVLKNLAVTVQKQSRNTDMFGRWGGEEFVGIYPIKNPSDIVVIGEKIRFLAENTCVTTKSGEQLFATLSVGITCVQPKDNIDSVIDRADKLMYESKINGKNCVTTG